MAKVAAFREKDIRLVSELVKARPVDPAIVLKRVDQPELALRGASSIPTLIDA